MYCPINGSENGRRCTTRCCRLYNFALGFLAVLVLATIGLILGAVFAAALTAVIPLLIVAAIILAILFIVTLITRGCCDNSNNDDE